MSKTIKLKPVLTKKALDYAWQKARKWVDKEYQKWMRDNIRRFLKS